MDFSAFELTYFLILINVLFLIFEYYIIVLQYYTDYNVTILVFIVIIHSNSFILIYQYEKHFLFYFWKFYIHLKVSG